MWRRTLPSESEAERHLRLVRVAILLAEGGSGYFEWDERVRKRVPSEFDGLDAPFLKSLAINHVKTGGRIRQKKEEDEEWLCKRRFDHWYSICFEVDGLGYEAFMKISLECDDEKVPEALIVGAHKSRD